MNETAIWAMEERFWLDGAEFFERMLDRQCVMAFPGVGILQGATIIDGLRDVPRWNSVEMGARVLVRLDAAKPDASTRDDAEPDNVAPGLTNAKASVIVLGYRARARRENAPPYRALCTSTYRADGEGWKLVQHQQSPVE